MNSTRILIVLLLFVPVFIYAQPRPPSIPVPLDGGLIALLAAGAVYGSKKYYSKLKND